MLLTFNLELFKVGDQCLEATNLLNFLLINDRFRGLNYCIQPLVEIRYVVRQSNCRWMLMFAFTVAFLAIKSLRVIRALLLITDIVDIIFFT